jgi:hypothetical protein
MIGGRCTTNATDSALFPKRVPLMLQVLEDETCDLNTTTLWSKGYKRPIAGSYAIDPETLPAALELDNWGRNLLLEYSELPDFRPNIMDKFLFAYLNTKPSLPSVSLSPP